MTDSNNKPFDFFIIGGGINGAGIARDAAGRGLSVALCDMNDFASGTSSASTKLIHGGLRYLEQYKFRLVREALAEREVLLRLAPHIIWPLSFVLPQTPGMRPGWMIRAGLWLYDHLGGPTRLPRSRAIDLQTNVEGNALRPDIQRGYLYSDCWVDDARLVILNLRAAADSGAIILPRTRCVAARRARSVWQVETVNQLTGRRQEWTARVLINAAGPWVKQVIDEVVAIESPGNIQLVKGSHIVVRRLYDGEHAYLLQNDDGRVVFIIPYEKEFTLIGTTDVELQRMPDRIEISHGETDYLCTVASRYLNVSVHPDQVLWSYAGIRPLYDDGSANPSELTRDYVLELSDAGGQAPMLSVFGGKITTYRRLAEHAMEKLRPCFPGLQPAWTSRLSLPGGDLAAPDFLSFVDKLHQSRPGFPVDFLKGLARRHGSYTHAILAGHQSMEGLGRHFGAGLTAAEVDYLMTHEWAREADDILWRRTKCGLHMSATQRAALASYVLLSIQLMDDSFPKMSF